MTESVRIGAIPLMAGLVNAAEWQWAMKTDAKREHLTFLWLPPSRESVRGASAHPEGTGAGWTVAQTEEARRREQTPAQDKGMDDDAENRENTLHPG